MRESPKNLLTVRGLKTFFDTEQGLVKAVDNINFEIEKGETLGIVGESGCGKSVTSLSIMNLVPKPRGKIVAGKITFTTPGEILELTALDPRGKKMRSIRGNEIAMIFQEPMTSLNPVYTIGEQIMEVIRLHQGKNKIKARERAVEMLNLVGIAAPKQRINEYPHELSGGMRQRVVIAMALSCNPSLLIADEPTTALDVTIESQILDLLKDLQNKLNMSIIFISHDLEVIGEMADRVIIMYAGKIVETATIDDIYYHPQHPYTCGLLASIPRIGVKKDLIPIKGSVPDLKNLPQGCYFAPRCPRVKEKCYHSEPPEFIINHKHSAKCWLYQGRESVS